MAEQAEQVGRRQRGVEPAAHFQRHPGQAPTASEPRPASTPTSGQRSNAIITKVAIEKAAASGRPSAVGAQRAHQLEGGGDHQAGGDRAHAAQRAGDDLDAARARHRRRSAPARSPAAPAASRRARRAAPRQPKKRSPSISARLTTFGPGSTWLSDSISTNCCRVSQRWRSTSSCWAIASTPPKPCRASRLKVKNSSAERRRRGQRCLGGCGRVGAHAAARAGGAASPRGSTAMQAISQARPTQLQRAHSRRARSASRRSPRRRPGRDRSPRC